jgi:large subunit ribosomal protein L9
MSTKVILTHEVTNLGEPGDIVEVKDGYARNYLLPRHYAIRWSRGAAKQVESIRAARESRAVHDREEAETIVAKLQAEPINVSVRSGEGGRLFGAVTVAAIADAIEAAAGAGVDKRRIDVGQPIKSLGAHEITVRVHPEVTAQVRLNVVAGK